MKRIVGDTVPMNGVSYIDANTPLDWTATGYTPKIVIETQGGTVSLAATSITAHPTQTVTLDSTNNWITCNDHGLKVGDQVVFATAGSLSGTGLTAAQRYHVVERDANWFRVSLTSGAAPITIAGAGTGAHTVYQVGSWQATNAQCSFSSLTAATYRFWVAAYSGGTQVETGPATQEGGDLQILPQGN
jgi:hypothetical protein